MEGRPRSGDQRRRLYQGRVSVTSRAGFTSPATFRLLFRVSFGIATIAAELMKVSSRRKCIKAEYAAATCRESFGSPLGGWARYIKRLRFMSEGFLGTKGAAFYLTDRCWLRDSHSLHPGICSPPPFPRLLPIPLPGARGRTRPRMDHPRLLAKCNLHASH
ncbi:hypothetical protein E2C01_087925 [Portunus trituberculatus]|uniref:Uncharacterized protein n=1 Tax=Portunus trituberculatus TaxID=210409 RepID=A0A5B7JFC9_PORTR|nr:hypothetical protein [Portunus trituberculatus]